MMEKQARVAASHPFSQPCRQLDKQTDRQIDTGRQTDRQRDILPRLTETCENRLFSKRSDDGFFIILQ